jgi:hypothetical protein
MTQDEIRKLLGGYATNALSADERRILFEAALEDQDLFNALQNEDALRELLADPVTRDQLRGALEARKNPTPRTAFWSRRWMFGVAMPAVAAIIIIAFMNRAHAPLAIAPRAVHTAASEGAPAPLPSPPTASPPAKKESASRLAPTRVIPAVPELPAPVQLEATQDVDQTSRDFLQPDAALRMAKARRAAPPPLPDAVRQQFTTGFAANAPIYQGPLVHYSLVRSGPAGNEVRVEVSTRIAGYLALYRLDAAGKSTRVYPENEVATLVRPDLTIQIPTSAIKIAGAGERLRLVVVPAATGTTFGQISGQASGQVGGALGGAVNGAVQPAIAKPLGAPPTPLVVDIPLAPN